MLFYLNGQKIEVGAAESGMMLADFLRQRKSMTGTKIVCAEGDCGACTVLRRFHPPGRGKAGKASFLPINSCITRVAQMDGSSLVTIEGLADRDLHPVQKAMVECHGSQCGFCTPGFVMALTGLVEKKLDDKSNARLLCQESKNALTGNLCRCTGYQPILDAASAIPVQDCVPLAKRYVSSAQSQELRGVTQKALHLQRDGFELFAPTKLKEAATFLKKNPGARILSGGTDLGVLQNKRKLNIDRAMSLHLIPELYEIKKLPKGKVRVGARVTLSELRNFAKKPLPELARFIDLFASPQIKNVATLAGNIGNASPIGDMPPFLLVAGTTVNVAGPKGMRKVPIEKFFLGYRKTALRAGELIANFEFDLPLKKERFALYKVSQRKDLDISTVNAAMRMKVNRGRIEGIRLAMGGIAATPLRLSKTEKALEGQVLDEQVLARGIDTLRSEMTPLDDLRGSSAYRRVLAEKLLLRFFREQYEKT